MLWGKNLADFVWFYAKMADLKKRPVGEKFRVLHKNRTHTETGPNSFHLFDNKENLRAICWPSVHPIVSKWFRLSYLCYFLDRKWIWCIFEGKKNQRFSSDYLLVCHCICCQLLHSSQYWILILSVCSLGDKEESLSKHFGWFFKSTRPILVCFWFLVSSFNQN